MAREEVVLEVKAEGTAGTVADVKSVDDAFKKLDTQIDGIRKSSDAFDVQKAKLNGMKEALIEGAAQAQKLGDKGKDAGEKFSAALKKVDVELDKIEKESIRSITPLERAFQSAEAAVVQFNFKAQSESGATTRDVERLWRTQEQLNIEIEKSEAEYGELGAEAKARLGEISEATDTATETVRRTNDAVADQRGKLNEAGVQWRGLGAAIQDAAGPMGAAVGRIGMITAAFQQGVGIGNRLNKVFQTDMSEWDRLTEKHGKAIGLAIAQIADEMMMLKDVIVEVINFWEKDYQGRVSKAWQNLQEISEKRSKSYLTDAEKEIEKARETAEEHRKASESFQASWIQNGLVMDEATKKIIDAEERIIAKDKALAESSKVAALARQDATGKWIVENQRQLTSHDEVVASLEKLFAMQQKISEGPDVESLIGKWDKFNEVLKGTEEQARKTAAAVMSIGEEGDVQSSGTSGDRLSEPS